MFPAINEKPLIYLITKGDATAENFIEKKKEILKIIKNAALAKASLIQIREKLLSAKLVFELASEAAKIVENHETRLLINDRADIALAAGCDGAHLTENSLPVNVVRRDFPANFIVGASTHALETAVRAKNDGANFVTFSPIFAVPQKGPAQGLEKLREVCKRLKTFPVIALGGIDETNYKDVLESGASGFAAIRYLNEKCAVGEQKKI